MISTLLDRLFQRSNVPSGTKVKQRLKFILAHDRAAIEPQVFDNMRHEIMRVVSKYVELDEGALDIRLESDKRMTALIANLPILTIREELPDLVSLFDQPAPEPTPEPEIDLIALEMDQIAEAALDAIAAKENMQSLANSETDLETVAEDAAAIAERNIEVTSKIRLAANKVPAEQDEKVIEENIPENILENIPEISDLGDRQPSEVSVRTIEPKVNVDVDVDVADITSIQIPETSQVATIEEEEPSDQLELSLDIIPPTTDSQT
jgi:cell division topological specificity factor